VICGYHLTLPSSRKASQQSITWFTLARLRIKLTHGSQMRHIAAYLLLQIGGNSSPSARDVKKVLSAVGIEADDDRLDKLISELEGKDVNQVGDQRHVLLSCV
jgi:hypothetical protein